MRIALAGALDLSEVSGIPRLMKYLDRSLSKGGHDVVLCGNGSAGLAERKYRALYEFDPSSVDVIHTFGSFGPYQIFKALSRVATVHTFTGTILGMGLSYLPLFGNIRASWFRKAIISEYSSWRQVNQITTVSEYAQKSVRRWFGVPKNILTIVPNGCAPIAPDQEVIGRLRQRLRLESGVTHWLFVGRTEDRIKNYRLAERAFLRFRARFPNSRLLVVTAEHRYWPDGVSGTGVLSDEEIGQLYCAVDGFLNCSYYDGMPLTLLEAMAAGLPVLATAAGGSEDVIASGRDGYLIPRDAETIAGLLLQLSRDDSLRRSIGVAARQTAGRYTWDKIAAQYCAVYRKAISGSAA